MKGCVSIHNVKEINKEISVNPNIQEIKEIISDIKNIIGKLEAAVEKLEAKKEIKKKVYTVEDIENMSNEEIQELFNNHICYVEYRKRNGEYRIFENFTFREDYRKKGSGNFDYNEELENFVFGIELDKNEYKRLLPQNIQYIEILA